MSDQPDSQGTRGGGTEKKPINLAVEGHPEPETTDMGSGVAAGKNAPPTRTPCHHMSRRPTTDPELTEDDLD